MTLPSPSVALRQVKRVLLLLLLVAAIRSHAATHIASAKSPYLRDHLKDAVEWYSWGDEAFARARSEKKLIFLSIGYSSCHWCHVMQRESFSDAAVGTLLNARYIPILVDREEMPDVDVTYLAFLQTMNDGKAGWPANLILTPDLSPLAASSYLKPDALRGALTSVADQWTRDPNALLANGASALAAMRAAGQQSAPASAASQDLVLALAVRLRNAYDRTNGGFGTAPKFLQPLMLDFLLRREGTDRDLALETLRKIARAGVHDQIGGGFHRYAVDTEWRLPHFEKMLGDQALMAIVCTEGWLITKDDAFQRIARDTLDYALERLKLPKGSFAAGEGADSLTPEPGTPHIAEGVYYAWKEDELRRVAWKNADFALYYFGIEKKGNLPPSLDPGGAFAERNFIWPHVSDSEAMKRFGLTKDQFRDALAETTRRLRLVRSHRPPPKRDDNVVTATNALMISALARAGMAFGDDHYIYTARESMRWLDAAMSNPKTGALLHGSSGGAALAEDYACMVQALLDVYEATYSVRWLTRAIELQQRQDDELWSGDTLRYASGSRNVPAALRVLVPDRDADLPAANSVAAMNLLRIATITGSEPARAKADAIFRSYAPQLAASPTQLPALASALAASAAPAREVIILGNPANDDTKALLRVVRETFAPIRSLVVASTDADRAALATYVPLIKEMKPVEQKATAYVCVGTVCKSPVTDAAKLAGILGE
jgi:uncharacterized protein YyaL (SSP411 family)